MSACHAVTLDQLLSVRDGEPVDAAIVSHADTCPACARELRRLRGVQGLLRELPQLSPPSYDSEALRRRALKTGSPRRWIAVSAAAAVAAIAILVTTVVREQRSAHGSEQEEWIRSAEPLVAQSEPVTEIPLRSLVIRSQELESRLRLLPKRPHVERGGTTTTISVLQNQIQWVDYQLSLADDVGMTERQSAELWQDRIALLDTLVKVRYAEAQRVAISY